MILQPTPFCNINCSYCYLPQRSDRTTLSADQIQRIFEKLVTFPTISKHTTVVWHAGDIYTFSPEIAGYSSKDFDTFAIGNIFTNSFEEIEHSSVLKAMTSQIADGVELCRASCKYFSVCGGGAPSNKVFENGTFASASTIHCELTKKRVTDYLLETIEAMA